MVGCVGFQQVNAEGVFKINLAGLPAGATPKCGPAVMCDAFQINGVGLGCDDTGFGAAGSAAQDFEMLGR